MSTQQVHSQNDTSPSVPQQKTSQHQWTSRSYIKTKETPLPGEIILLQYPMEIVKFPYGPTSQLAPSSSRPSLRLKSRKSKSSASNPTRFRATPHHVLVLRVLHDQQNKLIRLRFLPIFSYSKPPRGMNGFSWDPAQWMSEQASYASRLHHVPVPAEGWTSPPSPSSLAPALSFGSWMNNRPSWLAMVDVRHPISEEQEWFRHCDGPIVLDGGGSSILKLYQYLDDIPDLLSSGSSGSITTPTSEIKVNFVTVPHHHEMIVDLFRSKLDHSKDGSYDEDEEEYEIDYGPVTEEELQDAIMGNDGIDPVSFWNTPGAPKEMQEWAQQQEKAMLDRKILEWRSGFTSLGVDEVPAKISVVGQNGACSDTGSDAVYGEVGD